MKLVVIMGLALVTGCHGMGSDQPFTLETYPSPDEFLPHWNAGKGQHLHVEDWQKLSVELLVGNMATGMSLAYNANNRAYGIIGPPGKVFGMTCGSLFDLFVESGEDSRYLWFYLSNNFTGSGVVSAFKDGFEFRLFAAPGNPYVSCNVNPAPNRADTNISSGVAAAVAYANASGSPSPAAQAPADAAAQATDAVAIAAARAAGDAVGQAADAGAASVNATPATAMNGRRAIDADATSDAAEAAADAESAAREQKASAESREYRRQLDEARRVADERRNAEYEAEQGELARQRKEADALGRLQAEHQAKLDAEDPIRK